MASVKLQQTHKTLANEQLRQTHNTLENAKNFGKRTILTNPTKKHLQSRI
jgi:hypothetical protein